MACFDNFITKDGSKMQQCGTYTSSGSKVSLCCGDVALCCQNVVCLSAERMDDMQHNGRMCFKLKLPLMLENV